MSTKDEAAEEVFFLPFRRLVDRIPSGIVVWSVRGTRPENAVLLYANLRAENYARCMLRELVGQQAYDVLSEVDSVSAYLGDFIVEADATGLTQHVSPAPMLGKGYRIHAIPMGDGIVASVLEDITDEVGALDMLERSNRELEQFAYVASHDLQEPLRMVGNFVQLLFEDFGNVFESLSEEERNRAAEYKNFVLDGVNRMQELIKDLLRFSRAGRSVDKEEMDLGEAARSAVMNVAYTLRETQGSIDIEPLPRVVADPILMTQLFQNLFSNALKFRRRDEPPKVVVSATENDTSWIISVRDNGVGMEARHTARIFELFSRLYNRDKYPGTGIGLALCRKIVESHGGEIWAESEGANKGSTFYIKLPKT